MADREIRLTLHMLQGSITAKRMEGQSVDRVRIGAKLYEIFKGYAASAVTVYQADETVTPTIYGIPIDIDYVNPMCLEIATVTIIPVFVGSEGSNE